MDDVARRRWERSLLELRRRADEAALAWRRAGGYWPPGEPPSHPALFAVASDARERYYAAAAACYPQDLDDLLRGLRGGDRYAIERAISWLEADYFTRWTGYIKQKLLWHLGGAELTESDTQRLRAVVLHVCTRGPRQEFREVRRLARRQLADPGFVAQLQAVAGSAEHQTTRDAALRVLATIETVE